MSPCILHVSDLHLGTRNGADSSVLEQALGDLVTVLKPALVVASGDVTHRGRAEEHEAAAHFLRRLDAPLLVIPGNHDIPPFSPARFTHPWREFDRQWTTTEPVHEGPGLLVLGLNSVRPFGYQRGRVQRSALERAQQRLWEAPEGTFRVVAIHHQLAGAPWRVRKLPLIGRSRVLAQLARAGADLIIGGHIHQATVCGRCDFEEVLGDDERSCILATAPGLGRPRPGRRYEVRGVLVHRFDDRTATVETHVWHEDSWEATGSRTFPRA